MVPGPGEKSRQRYSTSHRKWPDSLTGSGWRVSSSHRKNGAAEGKVREQGAAVHNTDCIILSLHKRVLLDNASGSL